jgi:molybdopterin-biosynthesis enzyme MoeA-like protein
MDNVIKPGAPLRGGFGSVNQNQSGATPSTADANSWFEAMARAWGNALDKQAQRITELSAEIGESGKDNPSTITVLTAESLRMQFMASNASTANNSVGQALEALSRRQ